MARLRNAPAAAFARLSTVGALTFQATSDAVASTGWVGSGSGTVGVERPTTDVLVIREAGTWTPATGRPTTFANAFRWTLESDRLRLAHLRFGPDRPVELFELISAGRSALVSSVPHACRDDCYAATMTWDADSVRVDWRITGPGKAERIEHAYW